MRGTMREMDVTMRGSDQRRESERGVHSALHCSQPSDAGWSGLGSRNMRVHRWELADLSMRSRCVVFACLLFCSNLSAPAQQWRILPTTRASRWRRGLWIPRAGCTGAALRFALSVIREGAGYEVVVNDPRVRVRVSTTCHVPCHSVAS